MFELIDFIIVRPIINILFVIYGFIGDFGLAIILFTVLVKICMWPLLKRQLHQTRLMRKIQPELAEIKKNCKGNRQLESLQMMDLYKRNNIKPFRSMLTLFIQLPIFIALFTAVNTVARPTQGDNIATRVYTPVRQIPRIEEIIAAQKPSLEKIDAINANSALTPVEKRAEISKVPIDYPLKFLGLVDLNVTPSLDPRSPGFIIMFFAVASAVSQYWISRQQLPSGKSKKSKTFRQLMKEAAKGKDPDQADLNAAMSSQMTYMMPIMMFLVTINFPGALIFYYFVSNIITGVQQKYILGKTDSEMEISADKRVIRELSKIEEAQVITDNPQKSPDQKPQKSDKSSRHITKISATPSKSKRKFLKK